MRTILIVEDDHDTRVTLRNHLEEAGYNVLSATNGQTALDILRRNKPHPHLILMDMMLPMMNGPELMQMIRKHPDLSKIPILAISAYTHLRPTDGVVTFLAKPLDMPKLMSVVESYCA